MDSHAQIIVDFMAEHGITQVEMAQRLQVTAASILQRQVNGMKSDLPGKRQMRHIRIGLRISVTAHSPQEERKIRKN